MEKEGTGCFAPPPEPAPTGETVAVLNSRAAALIALQRPAEVLAITEQALAISPNDAEALNNRGVALDQLGRLEDALASFDQALAVWPHYLQALNNRASVLIGLKRPAEALASCDKALAIWPNTGQVLNNRGIALRDLGRKDEAVTAFRRALAAQPDIADFQTNLGATLQELGHLDLAEASLRKALPSRTPQVFQTLATVLYQMGKTTEAAGIYQQWLEHDPHSSIARHMTTAAAGKGTVPERASNEYVAELYNGFAETFDRRLADLQYQAHRILSSLLVTEMQKRHKLARILDAGCGTGLCGPLLRPSSGHLVGVDLSTAMISKARERQVYDELVVGELCAFMSDRTGAFDAVILADTLIYFGDLSLAFRAACLTLTPGGLLAFAVESLEENEPGPGYRLELHGRYTHRQSYTGESLRETGFSVLTMDRIVIRRERDTDVHGLAVLARKGP